MEEPNFSKYNPDYDDSEVIDIKDLFNFLVRNRLVIASFTIVFLLLSIIFSATVTLASSINSSIKKFAFFCFLIIKSTGSPFTFTLNLTSSLLKNIEPLFFLLFLRFSAIEFRVIIDSTNSMLTFFSLLSMVDSFGIIPFFFSIIC